MRPPCQIAFPANFVYADQGGQKAPQNICFACSEKRKVNAEPYDALAETKKFSEPTLEAAKLGLASLEEASLK